MKRLSESFESARAWLMRDAHRQKARALRDDVNRAFTQHPAETGETYLQHLWFTLRMAARFIYTITVLMIHGLFPFLLTRAAGLQIEKVYSIMKSRIPKARREVIDADYQV